MNLENSSKTDLFTINSSNQEFKNRRNNIFEQLDVAERTRKILQKDESIKPDDIILNTDNRSKKISTKHFRGKESIFKKPEAPISKCLPVRNIPDYHKNPHKWTKYTLEDVRDEDISDRGNTAAAMSFLKELENRNVDEDDVKMNELPKKIQFKKSAIVSDSTQNVEEETKHSFRSSKIVMPEYVVGQKLKKDKKNKMKRSGNAAKQLRLDHLLDEDDEG